MTTLATGLLPETLQSLVDARLDTIDRMLLGRVDRQDRLSIVREVETQIFDLLGGRDPGTLDRDDVLAVLARLDPPEAYLPGEGEATASGRTPRISAIPRDFRPSGGEQPGRLGLASGVLGLVSVALAFLSYPLAILFNNEFVLFGSLLLSFLAGILAIVFASRVRLRGAWAIVGLVTGILSLLAFIGVGFFLLVG